MAVQGIFCQDNDNTHFLFFYTYFLIHGGRVYKYRIERLPKIDYTLLKNFAKGDVIFKTSITDSRAQLWNDGLNRPLKLSESSTQIISCSDVSVKSTQF